MRESVLKCSKFKQLLFIVYLLSTCCCVYAEDAPIVGRKPASFVPDDDMIIVPIVIEKNVYERFNERHKDEFNNARKTLRTWIESEAYAEAYGLENRAVFLPTPDQKQRFFERRYMRFLSRDVERSTNQSVQNTLEEITKDEEIDSIRAVEMHEKVLIKAEKNRGQKAIKKTQSVKVGKEEFKFGFQPRIEIGMARFTLRSRFFRARAWLGVNGNQELYVERRFQSTDTLAFMNYKIEEERGLAVIDQRLSDHWSLRLTHDKRFAAPEDDPTNGENTIIQFRFGKRF